jgi:hypothetical protein
MGCECNTVIAVAASKLEVASYLSAFPSSGHNRAGNHSQNELLRSFVQEPVTCRKRTFRGRREKKKERKMVFAKIRISE